MSRELTREEKTAIRALVIKWCANYDREYGCLPLDCPCYMLGKCWTGADCRYFREAVLPNDPALEALLASEGAAPDFKACPVCGAAVPRDGRQAYCSAACARAARKQQKRAHMRKKRGGAVDN
ncbi:hypothetical protein OBV_32420 [Oscillibacter valericigenes Sjm18-20]|nr:hypothetical protein OBV_32420 [Oscillibacter valericigenes Sjm18-20]